MTATSKFPFDGLLLIDKPVGITSFDVIRHLRRSTGVKKMGHAGTLDPKASGLMLILMGQACKQAQILTKLDKSYRAVIRLGVVSSTGDSEGELTAESNKVPTDDEVQAALRAYTGKIEQVPSAYSAIKINGKEAYKRARAGEVVTMPVREVTIHEILLLSYVYPHIEVETRVSSGTYIRTLAEDIGRSLGCGGYLESLERTEVGSYKLSEASTLESLTRDTLAAKLRHL